MIVGQSYGGLLARGFINKYGELITKMILLVPCVIPGVRQGRVEPLVAVERDDAFLATLTKEEYDSFTLMNVRLTEPVWKRYREYLMPALARADWDFLNTTLEGSFSFDPDDMDQPSQIPVLIIAAIVSAVTALYAGESLTDAVIILAVVLIEQPEIFTSLVYSWLNSGRAE